MCVCERGGGEGGGGQCLGAVELEVVANGGGVAVQDDEDERALAGTGEGGRQGGEIWGVEEGAGDGRAARERGSARERGREGGREE